MATPCSRSCSAVVIIGLVVGAFFATYTTQGSGSTAHRTLVTADGVLRGYAEATKSAVRARVHRRRVPVLRDVVHPAVGLLGESDHQCTLPAERNDDAVGTDRSHRDDAELADALADPRGAVAMTRRFRPASASAVRRSSSRIRVHGRHRRDRDGDTGHDHVRSAQPRALDKVRDREYGADAAIEFAIANVRTLDAPNGGPALENCQTALPASYTDRRPQLSRRLSERPRRDDSVACSNAT